MSATQFALLKVEQEKQYWIIDGQRVSMVEVCGQIESIVQHQQVYKISIADCTGKIVATLWKDVQKDIVDDVELQSQAAITDHSKHFKKGLCDHQTQFNRSKGVLVCI